MAFVRGLSGAKNSLRIQGVKVEETVKKEVARAGRKGEVLAKQKAPVEFGQLRQSIFYQSTKKGFGARITANMKYAAYQEFGTGGSVDIPQGFEKVAAEFKKGGKINMKAQPYLIPSAKIAFEGLVKNLKKLERRK